MQVHPKFLEVLRSIRDDRVKLGKERAGQLSFRRLSLTLAKLLKAKPEIYNIIVNADINLKEG